MNIFKSQNTSADFDKLYKTGFELFEHYQYEEAVEAFSSAANLNPNDTRPLEMLAATYGNLRRWNESLQVFNKLEQKGHKCSNCYRNKSAAYRYLGYFSHAIDAIEKSLEIDPNNAQAWFEHGLYLGNFWANPEDNELVPEQQEKAVESFTRAIEFDASYYEAWLFKGITLYKSSHMAQAMQRASAAAGIEVPNSPNYFHESLESFDKAIGIDSFDTRAWIYKGKLLTELFNGYEKQSIEVFIKLTELQPEEAEHWYKLASVQHELNERQAVLNSLRKAISLDPELKEEAVRDFEDLANDKDFKEIVE